MSERVQDKDAEEIEDSIKDDGAGISESCSEDGQDKSQNMEAELEVEAEGLFFRVFLKILPDKIIAAHQFHPDFAEELTDEDQQKVSEILKQPIDEILEIFRERVKNPKATS